MVPIAAHLSSRDGLFARATDHGRPATARHREIKGES